MAVSAARSAGVAAEALVAGSADWRAAAIAMLSVRVIQGFIYWGGGSRRFIFDPSKLDPSQPSWMANKLQTAMPGALFGLDQVLAFLLQHFWLLYAAIILFSAVELIAGFALIAGLMTRLAALLSIGLSISLMLLFGWQGGTCVDEWTMAACNLAMRCDFDVTCCAAAHFSRQRLASPQPRAGRAHVVSLGRRKPEAAHERRGFSQSFDRGPRLRSRLRRRPLQLLPRLGADALSQRPRRRRSAPFHAFRRHAARRRGRSLRGLSRRRDAGRAGPHHEGRGRRPRRRSASDLGLAGPCPRLVPRRSPTRSPTTE